MNPSAAACQRAAPESGQMALSTDPHSVLKSVTDLMKALSTLEEISMTWVSINVTNKSLKSFNLCQWKPIYPHTSQIYNINV